MSRTTKVLIAYSKIACWLTLAETLYLSIGFYYPNLLHGFDNMHILLQSIFYFLGILFFVCFYNLVILFIIGITLLFRKSSLKIGVIDLIVCVIFYFVAIKSVGDGL